MSLPAILAATAESGSQLTGVAAWVVDVMNAIGAPGAGFLVALENLFPPLPSEVILPLAGFTASQGGFSLASAIFWTTLGSIVGAIALYWIGIALGRRRLRIVVDKMPLVDLYDLDRTEAWFDRHGRKAVFFGRMVPIFRSLISIPAGIERMPFGLFVLLSGLGSLIWNTIFVLAGFYLGENWHIAEQYASVFSRIVVIVVLVLVVWWVLKRIRRNRQARSGT
ncbi:DedA family protein [Kocuria rhizophila]|uniref:DedA family protein n=1 Tax=Kocuria rhizophila TaxID=72000 RepID=UPI00214FE51F|nr:DedA family protein [Kocuria rhizophila]MCR4525774.1 DedA family protein [Kocuria rhizophila]MDA4829624.1 DedA family protein [Kocuria rhizophila]WSQ06102.1 DedA family protein [Kocuria rhizophila]